jgi:hypothetical protein
MTDFHYTAAGANGKVVRGTRTALDRQSLAATLESESLLLISCSEEAKPASVLKPIEAALPLRRLTDGPPPVTRRQKWLAALVLITGVAYGLSGAYRKWHPQDTSDPVLYHISRLQSNMPRAEVEKIFTRRYERHQDPERTRYFFPPNRIVEVNFDLTGGPWSLDNRVKGSQIRLISVEELEQEFPTPGPV